MMMEMGCVIAMTQIVAINNLGNLVELRIILTTGHIRKESREKLWCFEK